ncbi:YceI family protein [Formosa sediminum]|uniref:YceI family protein n=1 Tax=Formosa sediminum TaxID=2594004 RepID=A0A516GV08_9FLAO|nr:YceI family protein [Formosa sediminum]QDO95325.1 YceI family protein [Formosa sediminum]
MLLKRITLVLVVIINVSFISINHKNKVHVSIKPSSKLTINGETNITDFSCVFNSVTLDKIAPITYISKTNSTIFQDATLVLNNTDFDCGKRMINKDFRALLKTETYPEIIIHLNEVKYPNSNSDDAYALVNFIIAGTSKPYKIPITITKDELLTIQGEISLNIRDFGLENPNKMLGLIKIEDVVSVHFKLDLEVL